MIQKETDNRNHVSFVKFAADTIISVNDAANLLKKLQPQTKESDEWKLSTRRNEIKDENDYTHQFYQQYYKGVKVEGGEFSVHAVNNNIESALGNFEQVGEVSVTANLSEEQALKYALKHIGAEVYKWQVQEEEAWIKEYYNDTYYPKGELVIVKSLLKINKIYRLAYKFDIYAHQPMNRNYVWVDAITGEVINIESRIHFSNATGTAATRYSGTRTITTDSYSGGFRLRETRNGVNISTFNMNHTGNYTSTDFTDNDNNWSHAEFHNSSNDDAALDAHWGAEMVYEYFKQIHLRNSWNNNNGSLLSYVNGNLPQISSQFTNSDNAFWDGNRMTYGQGNGTTIDAYVCLDVIAHEIGHGICESTVNLGVSATEKGAINESLSDIWGACLENYVNTTYGLSKDVWLHREEVGSANRSLSNPNLYSDPDTYQGNNWYTGSDVSIYVHTNSGVGNFWFFLLSQGGTGTNDLGNAYTVTGIGIEKAAKIVYKAETSYLTSSANYTQFRNASISAATNLYGANSLEVVSVTNAWHAVGVGNPHQGIIVGADIVCANSSKSVFQITLTNRPANSTITWEMSSNVEYCYQAGANTFGFWTIGYGNAWINANITTANNQTYQLQHNFWIGTPDVPNVSSFVGGPIIGVRVLNPPDGVNYRWDTSPANYHIDTLLAGDRNVNIQVSSPGTYTIFCWARNSCGERATPRYFAVQVPTTSPRSSIYPNPVSDILYVELDNELDKSADALETNINSENINQRFTYDIYLYDFQGSLVQNSKAKKGKVEFNVTSLPNGNYFLHIYNGKDEKPEIRQIIVRH
jgi:Zn-dependent metalloprotease